jgi:radical SAM/Cys-rich protein
MFKETQTQADEQRQVKILDDITRQSGIVLPFKEKLKRSGIDKFKPVGVEILQINMGKICNQACRHCHVNAGPDRLETMSKAILEQCLSVIKLHKIPVVDVTGGAPEMNKHFRWFIDECVKTCNRIIVRCNLTVIYSSEEYSDLPEYFASRGVEVVASLPFYSADRTDKMRGNGVFDSSISALKRLNSLGYGKENSGLVLNLVYNPSGAFLPAPQSALEKEFKQELKIRYDIDFNSLFTITNMPVSRFLDYLIRTDNYICYIENLVKAFNPVAAMGAMCLNMVSVSWDGYLYDCDFNQMLGLKIYNGKNAHISEFNMKTILDRDIIVSQHCYGCTAGGGSSCGGSIA